MVSGQPWQFRRDKEKTMIKIKKLLGDTYLLPDFIDLFYSILATWSVYYSLHVVVIGLFYLSDIFPSNILIKIWGEGEIPLELLRTGIQKGTFSQTVMVFFVFHVILRMLTLVLGTERAKIHSLCEIVVGFTLVCIGVHSDPIVTSDKVLIFLCWFMLIKLGLISVTRIFKIPTRHFGSFETKVSRLEIPMAGKAVFKQK